MQAGGLGGARVSTCSWVFRVFLLGSYRGDLIIAGADLMRAWFTLEVLFHLLGAATFLLRHEGRALEEV